MVTLRQGTNTVVLDAPPFRARQCVLTWPEGSDRDNCHGPAQESAFNLPDSSPIQVNGRALHPNYTIFFPLALPDLPSVMQQQAINAVSQLLAGGAAARQAAVQPGEHYAEGLNPQGVTIAGTATAPLTATPILALQTRGTINGCADVICPTTGSADDLAHSHAGGPLRWAVQVLAIQGWRFTTSDGSPVGSVQFPHQPLTLSLALDATSGWQVAAVTRTNGNPALDLNTQIITESCNEGELMAIQLMPAFSNRGEQGQVSSQGCILTTSDTSAAAGPTASFTLLWHFGVLLAADAATHQHVPQLPLATPAERAALMA